MSVLRNPRHERFVQYLAQGKSATDAYALAGYKPSRGNASNLLHRPDVSKRLRQIMTKRAVAVAVTAESLIEQNQKVFDAAMEAKQLSAAVGANKEISILAGIRIERSEVGAPGEFDHMSDAELLTAIRERFARLERELRLPISNGSVINGNGVDTDIEGS
jgi:phage terminase small subunit